MSLLTTVYVNLRATSEVFCGFPSALEAAVGVFGS